MRRTVRVFLAWLGAMAIALVVGMFVLEWAARLVVLY